MNDEVNSAQNKETMGFQTKAKQLLHLMIHSLYSNKEIFLRELISNASDAIDKVRFQSLSNPDLVGEDVNYNIRVVLDKDASTVTITDNGIGIAPEFHERIFERFYRIDKARNRKLGGSGLGLSIVKHIIQAHGERIFVESKYGVGSKFSFTLEASK